MYKKANPKKLDQAILWVSTAAVALILIFY
jgi:hypothetical protein